MEPAAKKLEEFLDKETLLDSSFIKEPIRPIVSNTIAEGVKNPKVIKQLLIKQMVSPVLWAKSIELCKQRNIHLYLEIGPGRILSGLMKQISPTLHSM